MTTSGVDSPREIVERYYEYANAGAWDNWCDLFAEDLAMDEQLAGRIEGLATLRSMMAGFPALYPVFTNQPRHLLVDGDQVAVVSHLRARTPAGDQIDADVMNYFQIRAGRIAYMANFHDTVPFRPGNR